MKKTPSRSVSKKKRFEIFKRDGFVCQYCGRTPPDTVLEIDHIQAVTNGGNSDIDNLITACFDCNRGKGARELTNIPATIKEKHEVLAEKEAQLVAYRKLSANKKRRENADIKKISTIFSEIGTLTQQDRRSLRVQFLPKLAFHEVEEAMELAVLRWPESPNRVWKYFCGICWNKIKRAEGGAL